MSLFSRQTIKAGEILSIYFNPRRVFLLIVNDSEATIYISQEMTEIKERGLPIYPYEILVFDKADGDKTEGPYYVYSDVDTKIRIYEGVV
jgi:hypothetical protein